MISFSTIYLDTELNDLYILSIHVMDISDRIWVARGCTVPCMGGDQGVPVLVTAGSACPSCTNTAASWSSLRFRLFSQV